MDVESGPVGLGGTSVSLAGAASPSLAQIFARAERMVGRKVAGEYILVPIVGRGVDLDAIFNLNGVGAFIWERFDGKTGGDAIVQALVERYKVETARATADYCDFIGKLQSIQAVTEAGEPKTNAGAGT